MERGNGWPLEVWKYYTHGDGNPLLLLSRRWHKKKIHSHCVCVNNERFFPPNNNRYDHFFVIINNAMYTNRSVRSVGIIVFKSFGTEKNLPIILYYYYLKSFKKRLQRNTSIRIVYDKKPYLFTTLIHSSFCTRPKGIDWFFLSIAMLDVCRCFRIADY